MAVPVSLAVGSEPLLVDRAVSASIEEARRHESDAEVTRVAASEVTAALLLELLSPTLFAAHRVLVITDAHELNTDTCAALVDCVTDPPQDVTFVVTHNGKGRSKAVKDLPSTLRKAGATVTECAPLTKQSERESFVRSEVRRAGGRIDADAVTALVDAVGSDLTELASAATQLVSDTAETIDVAAVRRFHTGRADVTGFAVAEKVVAGERASALETLRWAQHIGVPDVLIADAMADAVRTIARVSAAGPGNPNQLAGELRLPPWKVRKAKSQARGWSRAALAESMRVVARLNADVKGAAAHNDWALERAVLDVIAARDRR